MDMKMQRITARSQVGHRVKAAGVYIRLLEPVRLSSFVFPVDSKPDPRGNVGVDTLPTICPSPRKANSASMPLRCKPGA
jgi:hypothetical protein